MGTPPHRALVEIGELECWELASSRPVGRLAHLGEDDLLFVTPLNFHIDAHEVTFRTAEGAQMVAAARRGASAALEIDDLEGWSRSGWSVLIRGRLSEVTDPDDAHRVLAGAPSPWAAGERGHVVRLTGVQISGRRIEAGPGGVTVVRL